MKIKLFKKYNAIKSMFTKMVEVQKKHNILIGKQIIELIRLRSSGIGSHSYYNFRLYDPVRFKSLAEKKTFRDWRFKNRLRRFSDPQIQGITFHKHIFYRLLESFDLPHSNIYALYCPVSDGFERHRCLKNMNDLEHFLKNTKKFPIFGKPSNASHGYGAIGMLKKEGEYNIRLLDGSKKSIKQLVDDIDFIAQSTGTYMLCELLEPNNDFKEISGEALPSCRVIILVRNGMPEFFRATILLPQFNRHVSNFQGGANRSIVAGIDLETGAIFNALNSENEYQSVHPESGKQIEGYCIPKWKEAKKMLYEASLSFSPFRMQHWDIAFTTKGPVILELNFIGDVEFQMVGPPGIFTEQFKTFYETHKVW